MVGYSRWTKILQHRSCPLCGSNEQMFVSTNMQHDLNLPTVICTKCTFVFTNPVPKRETYDQFYTEAYAQLYGHIASRASRQATQVLPTHIGRWLTNIERLKPLSRTRLLEVGPGKGQFLWWAQKKGASVLGIEPSVAFYNDLLEDSLPCIHGSLESVDLDSNVKYDIIVMFHVFEHFYDPNTYPFREGRLPQV